MISILSVVTTTAAPVCVYNGTTYQVNWCACMFILVYILYITILLRQLGLKGYSKIYFYGLSLRHQLVKFLMKSLLVYDLMKNIEGQGHCHPLFWMFNKFWISKITKTCQMYCMYMYIFVHLYIKIFSGFNYSIVRFYSLLCL